MNELKSASVNFLEANTNAISLEELTEHVSYQHGLTKS